MTSQLTSHTKTPMETHMTIHSLRGSLRGSRRFLLACLVMLTALAVGCEATRERVRATTMPPDLRYLPPEQIRTAMWVLAAEIAELERILETPELMDRPVTQSDVRARLARMRVAAESIDVPGKTTQHPVLNRNLDRFLGRLRQAERAVDRDPPNYFPASTLAGACFVCHGQNVGLSPEAAGSSHAGTMQRPGSMRLAGSFSRNSDQAAVQRRPRTTR